VRTGLVASLRDRAEPQPHPLYRRPVQHQVGSDLIVAIEHLGRRLEIRQVSVPGMAAARYASVFQNVGALQLNKYSIFTSTFDE
jgi:hypothetical protein